MSEAQRGLDRSETGDGIQEQQSQAIIRLNEALKQAQQQQQQQQQQASGRRQRRPGQQQAGNQQQGQQENGQSPAMESRQRPGGNKGGLIGELYGGSRGFGGLDPRSMDALRQGYREKIPAEYQEFINRYYQALSKRGR